MKSKIKIILLVSILSFVFIYVIFPFFPEGVRQRLSYKSVMEDKGSGRFTIWNVIIKAVTESEIGMFFGFGLGSTAELLKDAGIKNSVAHNHWIQLWCDQGLVGMSLFLVTIIAGQIRTFKNYKSITMSLLGMLILSMSLTMYAEYKPFWNILMMSALNIENYEER